MSEQLLFVLKLCLLALLVLFFLRVIRAVWAEMRVPAPPTVAAPSPKAKQPRQKRRKEAKVAAVTQLRMLEPPELRGRTYPLGSEATIGRAAGCQVTLDDTFVSQLHARVFGRDGQWMVEDLGSTNGTYLNRTKVSGPMLFQVGDRLQIGNTIMELA